MTVLLEKTVFDGAPAKTSSTSVFERRPCAVAGRLGVSGNGGADPVPAASPRFFSAILPFLLLLGLVLSLPTEAYGQLPAGARDQRPSPPSVFLDCQGGPNCNQSQFRTEIRFVHWVRDRADSDVHVIFTSQPAGGGGRHYTLDFTGRRGLEGMTDQLTYISDGQDVQVETMDGLARTLRLGLLRYALHTGMGANLDIDFRGMGAGEGLDEDDGEGPFDPWNYWTFQVAVSGDLDFRQTRSSSRLFPRFDADRVTEHWKLNVHGRVDFRRERRDLADGRHVRDDRDDWRISALIVRSVGDHIGIGIDTEARNSVQQNQHSRIQFNPAVEYNYFPYAEATRRQFIGHYSVGVERSHYIEETIYGAIRETLPQHRLGVQYRVREAWGNAGVGINSAQYLHDASLFSFGISGDLSYRVLRGLDLNLSASASSTNDNIHTPAGDISDEDILLGRQSLPSSYQYRTSVGFSYRWGSPFANIVNSRFPRSVR